MSRRVIWMLSAVLCLGATALAQSPTQDNAPPRSDDRSAGESSSKDNRIDTSAPNDDSARHPNSELPSDVNEMRTWDPHKAEKNIEVGDFHLKRQNYRAAASRFEEALEWKPGDAEATYKLALSEEKLGQNAQARQRYEEYLKILPHGPFADDSKKALARLPKAPELQPGTKATAENSSKRKSQDKTPN